MDHDTLPVVDREPFMDAYQGRIQPPPATVLVYAIWTYTFSILPPGDPLLKKYNIEDSEHLFEVFWEHTSSIMRSEYLTPRYATIQALVLLCMIPNTHNVFHKNWVRAGMAVRMVSVLFKSKGNALLMFCKGARARASQNYRKIASDERYGRGT
jgi:hypothetical protein